MFGFYLTDHTPFKTIHLHAKVTDEKVEMSKVKVINPSDVVEKYGADALRFALVYGVAKPVTHRYLIKKLNLCAILLTRFGMPTNFVTILLIISPDKSQFRSNLQLTKPN